MSLSLASVLYLPPASFSGANASTVLANLKKYPPKHRMLIYSDDESWKPEIEKEGWVFHKLSQSPEVARKMVKSGPNHKWCCNNLVFLSGLNLAMRHGFSHVIYLESDCRVGKAGWDEIMFNEHFSIGRPLICSGSLVVYNPANSGLEALRRWEQLVSTNTRRNFPIPCYGWVSAADKHPSMVFPNGALSIFDITWMKLLFSEVIADGEISAKTLNQMFAWDFWIGEQIWKRFGHESYDVVGMLTSIFSSYGEIITTESERMQMLRRGDFAAIHQCKSDATI